MRLVLKDCENVYCKCFEKFREYMSASIIPTRNSPNQTNVECYKVDRRNRDSVFSDQALLLTL